MKFESNPVFREAQYNEIVAECLRSRASRVSEYDRLRSYYLFGSQTGMAPATFNKIYPSIDTLVSFLFAVDTTRFTIKLGAEANKKELTKIPPLVERLNDKWEDSNADIVFSSNVSWSLVYGSTFIKLVQKGKETHPYILMPHNFGVLNESQPMLDRQEAFTHVFSSTRAQLERELLKHPRRDELMARMSARPTQEDSQRDGAARLIINNLDPLPGPYSGNVNDALGMQGLYTAETREDVVELNELWVWDDDALDGRGDYRIVTTLSPDLMVYDRLSSQSMFMRGEHPFTQVCPNPAPDYFWGYSEVERLVKLQDLREKHLQQIDKLVDRNIDTAKALQGQWGALEEKDQALQRLGALISSQDPTAKVTEFKPTIPPDVWAIVDKIDGMFDEMISLSALSKGHGDTGVRSKGQTESLLRVGSSRPKKRALTIEDSIERVATQYLKLDQQHNPDKLKPEEGPEFISEQFTKDFTVRVDAHSSSPVFVEDQKAMALELFKLQVIDGEELLEMLQPRNLQILKAKFKKMAAAKAEQQKQQQMLEAAEKISKAGGNLKSVGG